MKRLGVGIHLQGRSIRAIVNCAAGRKEKRFPAGTPLREIKRWRETIKVKLEALHPSQRAGAIGRHTFSADVKKYLAHLTIASWDSRRSELRAWEARIGKVRRSAVTPDHVRKALKAWDAATVPPKTALNRLLALTAMYHAMDGPHAWTPADDVTRPKPVRRRPVYVGPETIIAVEARLRTMNAKTRGRFFAITPPRSACASSVSSWPLRSLAPFRERNRGLQLPGRLLAHQRRNVVRQERPLAGREERVALCAQPIEFRTFGGCHSSIPSTRPSTNQIRLANVRRTSSAAVMKTPCRPHDERPADAPTDPQIESRADTSANDAGSPPRRLPTLPGTADRPSA